ncbi:MAG: sulfatase-like hydrolase/transferase [Gemmatimonadetes bacterium]|jgi:arylsulfatase A-like enzyme|nr:sulfatase-like hydrolase/transferase [Gemmatimonadota bacterium]MBT6147091.1 sulfatase-like hydrolase/transferase [Gemmatimonadota bacterium]MBT7862444.1 sulfatase-like hydrolase/transferase [Gemmatimonadota bacterium]
MTKPNILIFMTDQQRASSVLPGDPYKAKTPVLDAFRQDSVTFSRTFCPSPHCCPSRASFMTGLMPTQHGVWHNVNVANAITRGMKSHIRPWSVDLREAGYHMLFTGKWHVSNDQQPCDYGWEQVYPEHACQGMGMSREAQDAEALVREHRKAISQGDLQREGKRSPGEIQRPGLPPYIHYGDSSHPDLAPFFRDGAEDNPFGDRTVVDAALARMDTLGDDEPWCMYVGTLGPHDPYIVPKRFLELYEGMEFALPDTFDDPMDDKPGLYRRTRDRFHQLSREEHQEAIRHYLAFCTYEDWLFGRLIDKLKERGEYEDTIVLYLSDHGDYLGDHGLWCKGLPSFLSCYHVPAIVKMPGGQQGVVCDELVSLCDFGPTFLEMGSAQSPVAFAGHSLMPLLEGNAPAQWRDALFFQTNGNETYGIQRSVVTDRWRFVYNGFDYDELYDLASDPGQMLNLARDPEHGPVVEQMYRRIWDFGLAHDEHLLNGYIMTAMADYGPGIATSPQS